MTTVMMRLVYTHAAARFVAYLRPRDHVTAALMALHWLPVRTNGKW